MTTQYQVSLVLDPDAGVALDGIAADGPTWVLHSPANRAACERLWRAGREAGAPLDLTLFTSPVHVDTEAEWGCILDNLETHHGQDSHVPPLESIRVIGASVSFAARRVLATYGYEVLAGTPT